MSPNAGNHISSKIICFRQHIIVSLQKVMKIDFYPDLIIPTNSLEIYPNT